MTNATVHTVERADRIRAEVQLTASSAMAINRADRTADNELEAWMSRTCRIITNLRHREEFNRA